MSIMPIQDPRADVPNICAEIVLSGSIEWICVAAPHDGPPQLGHTDPADEHYFVRRYPNRPGEPT